MVNRTSNTRSVTAQTLKSLSRPQHVGNGCSPSPSGRSSTLVGLLRNNADSSNAVAAKYGNGYDNSALSTNAMLTNAFKPRVGKLLVMTSCVSSPNVRKPIYAIEP